MNTINVNLTGQQVLHIADALNKEAKHFDQLRETRNDVPRQTKRVWHDSAKSLRNIATTLVNASADDNRSGRIPVVVE